MYPHQILGILKVFKYYLNTQILPKYLNTTKKVIKTFKICKSELLVIIPLYTKEK